MSTLLRRGAVLALLFALAGVGRLPARPVSDGRAEVARLTTSQPRATQPVRRAIAIVTTAATSRVFPSLTPVIAQRSHDPRSRFTRRLYLRHCALLV